VWWLFLASAFSLAADSGWGEVLHWSGRSRSLSRDDNTRVNITPTSLVFLPSGCMPTGPVGEY
jgi:hypothetical protein